MIAITITLSALLAIIAGIIIIVWKRSLNWVVGLYLILFGILQFFGAYIDLSPPL